MHEIIFDYIDRRTPAVALHFSYDESLSCYFKQNIMKLEYLQDEKEINLTDVPDSILIIPWLCNVLPIAWLTDSKIKVPVLDKSFFDSIDKFKQGYIDMYPDCNFQGELVVNKLEYNSIEARKTNSAMFFSAGVDAYCTLIRHIEENPILLTVWGADIPYDNYDGWTTLKEAVRDLANELDLPLIIIHSSFREMINEHNLTKTFHNVLHDGWWHGAQHGIGLIGHAAPIDFLNGVSIQYIAASYWDGANSTCASWPTIDNNVRFFNCIVKHDAFIPRQEKIKIIADGHRKNNILVKMHVCWKTTNGNNCCVCEKCCRTIMGLLVEGENPVNYGFKLNDKDIRKCISLCQKKFDYDFIVIPLWNQIKERAIENREVIQKLNMEKYVDWLYSFDFEKIGKTIPRIIRRNNRKIVDKIISLFFHTIQNKRG